MKTKDPYSAGLITFEGCRLSVVDCRPGTLRTGTRHVPSVRRADKRHAAVANREGSESRLHQSLLLDEPQQEPNRAGLDEDGLSVVDQLRDESTPRSNGH